MRERGFDPGFEATKASNINSRQSDIASELGEFGVEYNENFTEQENQRRADLLSLFESRGLIEFTENGVFYDIDGIKQVDKKFRVNTLGQYQNTSHVIQALAGVIGYPKQESGKKDRQAEEPSEVLALPKDLNDLVLTYPERSKESLLKPWEIGKAKKWAAPIKLPSGETTNLAELMFASELLGSLRARRLGNDNLMFFNPKTGGYEKFSVSKFIEITGFRPKGKDNISILSNARKFVESTTPNLLKMGIIHLEDFSTQTGSKSAEVYGLSDRELKASDPYSPVPSGPHTIRYYFGRNFIVGTEGQDKPLINEGLMLKHLDSSTWGIVKRNGPREEIVYIFSPLPPEEVKARREQTAAQLKKKGQPATETQISQNAIVSAKETARRIRPFSIAEYLPKRPKESDAKYADRIARLSDHKFVVSSFRSFFSEAGIGVHQLPWEEQLVLANAIMEVKDKPRLLNFAKRYGMAGIRTFLSVDHDPKMAEIILALGELSPESSKVIFRRYNEIIDLAARAVNYAQEMMPNAKSVPENILQRTKDNLMRKAEGLLENYFHDIQNKKQLQPEKIEQDMKEAKLETQMFTSVFKAMKEEFPWIDLNDLGHLRLDTKQATDYKQNTETVNEMKRIYLANYSEYPQEFRDALIQSLERSLDNPNSRFHTFKHDGKLIAFCRFDNNYDQHGKLDHKYFAAFNTDPAYQNSKLGEALIENALMEERASGVPIKADCDPTSPIAKRYIEMGFVAKSLYNFKGVPSLKIILDSGAAYESKKMTADQIVARAGTENSVLIISEISAGETPKLLPFKKGYALTRYFTKGNKTYCVFEKLKQEPEAALKGVVA